MSNYMDEFIARHKNIGNVKKATSELNALEGSRQKAIQDKVKKMLRN